MGFTAEAIAGLDFALWDLLGKYRQEPVWRLLGGADRQTLPVYSSGIPGDTSEKQVQQLEGILARSFTTAKCGSGSLQMQMDLIRPLSKAMSDRGTLLYDAIRFAHFLQELGNVEWFEDALIPEDASGYARLTEATPGLRIAQLADTFGLLWAPHVSISTPLHLAAGLHLGAATPNFLVCEYPTSFDDSPIGKALCTDSPVPKDGAIEVTDAPGLGVSLDEAQVEQLTALSEIRTTH